MISAARLQAGQEEQKHREKEKQKEIRNERVAFLRAPLASRFSSALVFAANRFEDRIDPFRKAAFVVVVSKMRFDPMFGDVVGDQVRERAFQSVADLNEHFSVLGKTNKTMPLRLSFWPTPHPWATRRV